MIEKKFFINVISRIFKNINKKDLYCFTIIKKMNEKCNIPSIPI